MPTLASSCLFGVGNRERLRVSKECWVDESAPYTCSRWYRSSCFHDAPIAILCADYSSFPLTRDLGIHGNLNDLEWGSSESCYYYYFKIYKKRRYFIEKLRKITICEPEKFTGRNRMQSRQFRSSTNGCFPIPQNGRQTYTPKRLKQKPKKKTNRQPLPTISPLPTL